MFGGYRDVQLAGEGGLGRVYRAVRESTGGVVAIKELREVPSASPAWHRARRELDAMLRLKGHPFVVSVEEIFDGPDGPCIVMEYLDGGTLMERMRFGRMAVPELLLVGEQVTQALGAAHEAGIVHRDVKPHNLLVGSFGQIKVADFGIAALTREVGLRTQTQAFTLAYASPEELDGEVVVRHAADVYSFAATVFHLATARKPSFRDRTDLVELDEIGRRHPAMVPVASALRQCLEIDPLRRPSMRELHRVFGTAAFQLGEWRVTHLGAPGSVLDPPVPLLLAAPASDTDTPTFVRLTVADTMIRVAASSASPPAPPPPAPAPPVLPQNVPSSARSSSGSGRKWFAAGAATALLCAVAAVVTLLLTRGDDPPALAAQPATALPTTFPATTVAPITVTTSAASPESATPRATAIVTLLPTITAVVAPTPPPTVPTPQLLSESTATLAFVRYLDTAVEGSYPEAWAMLTTRYQLKYRDYETFVGFWESVNGAGLRSASSTWSGPTGQVLRCYVWFGRIRDGAIVNEIVDVDLIIDPASSVVLIDDYRYQGQG